MAKTIDEILEDFGYAFEVRSISTIPDIFTHAKQEIWKVIEGELPKKENHNKLCHCSCPEAQLDNKTNLIMCNMCGKQLGEKTWNACVDAVLAKLKSLLEVE